MIALILGTLRSRWAQAVTLGVLAVVAAGSAVVGPAYLRGVDRALIDHEVGSAPPQERGITLSTVVEMAAGRPGTDFSRIGPALTALPGFSPVFSIDVTIMGLEQSPRLSRLVYRQGACAGLTMVAGRCLVAGGEAVIGEDTAKRRRLSPGDTFTLTYAAVDPFLKAYVPSGLPATLTVAGVYRVANPTDPSWGARGYFSPDTQGSPAEPVFTDRGTVSSIDHQLEQDTVDVLATDVALTPDRLPALRGQLDELIARLSALGTGVNVTSDMPDLLDRVDAGRRQAHQLVPVAAVPLLMLAWFVIFLAVGYGTSARRRELGLLALRGTRPTLRWVLAGGEHLVPIALGTAVGYPLGLLAANALARDRLGEPAAGDGLAAYALAAGAGAVLAALMAQRRELFGPVAGLLRRVSAGGRWRSASVEGVVLVLAVAAAVSLRTSGGRLTGVGMLVPALVIAAIAMVSARAVIPLAGRLGRWELRRGRVGAALAALQLGRRAGVHRLFVLLVAAVAVLGFVATAFDVAAQARADRAEIGSGAVRVLTVGPVSRAKLLLATRAVDPDGRFAMAVVKLPDGAPGELPRLAVDSGRLATAAAWRPDFGGPAPARLADLLSPPLPAPLVVTGDRIELDVTAPPTVPYGDLDLTVLLAPLSGANAVGPILGPLRPGRQTLPAQIGCHAGCRLVGVGLARPGGGPFEATVTLNEMRTTDPAAVVIPASRFATLEAWRPAAPAKAVLSGDATGLRLDLHSEGKLTEGWVSPADRPGFLPVAATATLPADSRMVGLDGLSTPVRQVARLDGLPRLGRSGALVDLAVADRLATDAGSATDEEIWLGPSAPADVSQRLRQQGVVVVGDSGVGAVRAGLDAQGPALALWFYLLAAALAILLAAGGLRLVAAVDRDRGAAALRALSNQGVPGGVIGRAGLLGYLMVVSVALLVGPLTAAVAWAVAGGSLPTAAGDGALWPAPRWPHALPVLWPWAVAAAMLVAVAVLAGFDLRKGVREGVR